MIHVHTCTYGDVTVSLFTKMFLKNAYTLYVAVLHSISLPISIAIIASPFEVLHMQCISILKGEAHTQFIPP